MQVSERTSKVTSSSILFRFNCSWFSDINGAVSFFAIIVAESEGRRQEVETADYYCKQLMNVHRASAPSAHEMLQPEQRHPLASYQDYSRNSSLRAYQTAYFSSRCAQHTAAPAGQVM